jgi:uncharacterized membrane protein
MRPLSLVLLSALPLLLIAGCSRGAKGGGGPTHVVSHDLNAGGEPTWSAQVRGDKLSFSTGETLSFTIRVTRADHGAAGEAWSGPLPAPTGQPPMTARLSVAAKPCQDGAMGLAYPLTAVVEAPGGPYRGCAAPPGQGLGPRK